MSQARKDPILESFENAIQQNNLNEINRLLDSNPQLKNEILTFINAAGAGKIDIVKAFIKHGVDINSTEQSNYSALTFAALHDKTDVVRELLASTNIDVNAISSFGQTALSYAIRNKNISIVKMLLDKGANPYLYGSYITYSPLELTDALKRENLNESIYSDILKLFEKYGLTEFMVPGSHGKLIDLYYKLGYVDTTKIIYDKLFGAGLCQGYATIGAIICDDEKSIKKFNRVLSLCNTESSTDEVVNKIHTANRIHFNAVKKFNSSYGNMKEAKQEFLQTKLKEIEYLNIIGAIVDSEFDNINQNERKSLMSYFYEKYYRSRPINELIPYYESCVRNKIDQHIYQFIREKKISQNIPDCLENGMTQVEVELFLDLESYIENVAMVQDLKKNNDLIDQELQLNSFTQSTSLGFYFLSPENMNGKKLVPVKDSFFTSTYSVKDLVNIFTQLQDKIDLKQWENIITIPVSSGNHATFVKYIPSNKKWVIFDINRGKVEYGIALPQLADILFEGNKNTKDQSKILLSMQLFSSVNDSKELEACMSKQKNENAWKSIHSLNKDDPDQDDIIKLAAKKGNTNTVKSEKPNFFIRNWKMLANSGLMTALAIFGLTAGLTVASVFTLGISLGVVSAIAAVVIVGYTIKSDGDDLNRAIDEEKRINIIASRYENSHIKMLNNLNSSANRKVEELLIESRSAYIKKCKILNKGLKEILKSYSITEHSKKIQTELDTKNSPEVKLSKIIAHAFDAIYYQSLISSFSRSRESNKLYQNIIACIDIDKSIDKICQRIKDLNGKVYGIFAGTPIDIDGKELRVSGQVANLYAMLLNINTMTNLTNKYNAFAEVLNFANEEASSLTSKSSFIRHNDVWQFFAQVNEMLVVNMNASFSEIRIEANKRKLTQDLFFTDIKKEDKIEIIASKKQNKLF